LLVSVNELIPNSSINVYPNPAKNVVTIEFADPTTSKYKIKITDITGKIVYTDWISDQRMDVDIQNIAPGIYMVEIVGSDNMYQEKLIIK